MSNFDDDPITKSASNFNIRSIQLTDFNMAESSTDPNSDTRFVDIESTFEQTTANPNPNNNPHVNVQPLNSIITKNADQIRLIKISRQIQDIKFCTNSIR